MGKKYTLDSITGLKGLFSILIVLFHTLPSTPLIAQIPLTSFIRSYGGSLGNAFFFIASGFLITFGYRERIGKKEVPFKTFLAKRLYRLYPLYLITNLAALLINICRFGFSAINLKDLVFTLLLQKGGGLDAGYPYNGPSWFLSALLICYMAFYFMAYHAKNPTHYFCMIAFGIIWGYSILSGRWVVPLAFAHHGGSFFNFFIGCGLAEVYPLVRQRDSKWLQTAAVFLLAGCGILLMRYGVEVISGDTNVAFACVICPLLMYLAISNKLFSGFLQSRPVRYLGKISFSIYLWHFVVYDFFRYSYAAFSGSTGIEEPQYLLYLALMLLVSILSDKWMENFEKKSAEKVKP